MSTVQNAVAAPSVPIPGNPVEERPILDLAREVIARPGFRIFVVASLAIIGLFWSLVSKLPDLWFVGDSLYSHGPLVPLIAGYIFLTRWDRIKEMKVAPTLWPWLLLVPALYITFIASRTDMMLTLSLLFFGVCCLVAWALAGWKIALASFPAIAYLLFGLPVWSFFVDKFTQPLQEISTKASYTILQALGYNLFKSDSTTIMLDRFEMNIAAPCSGMKLILSLVALLVFFVLIARLPWWSNLILLVFVIPFAIIVNGVRIALIGVVGNTYGHDAGHAFHDYSGYLSLIVCFLVLRSVTRALGWK
jgi:exosortase